MYSEAEEAEGCFGDDHQCHLQSGENQNRRDHVRHDMAQHDAPARHADRSRRFHELHLLDAQCLAAHHASVVDPQGDRQGQHHGPEAGTQDRHDHQGEKQEGKGEQEVGQPHDDVVDDAAGIAGYSTEQGTDRGGQRDHDDGDRHRGTGPDKDPAEDIPPQIVATQDVLPAAARRPGGRQETPFQDLLGGVVRRKDRGCGGAGEDQADQQQPGEPFRTAAQRLEEPSAGDVRCRLGRQPGSNGLRQHAVSHGASVDL